MIRSFNQIIYIKIIFMKLFIKIIFMKLFLKELRNAFSVFEYK